MCILEGYGVYALIFIRLLCNNFAGYSKDFLKSALSVRLRLLNLWFYRVGLVFDWSFEEAGSDARGSFLYFVCGGS